MARILVVDDDESIRRTLQAFFTELGYEVEAVPSAEAALNRLGAFEPMMVLTDIQMSGLNGLELLARIREHKPDVAVVVFTGFTDVQGAIDAVKGGAYDYLSKPLDLDQVEDVVKRCLADRDSDQSGVPPQPRAPFTRRASDLLVGRHPSMIAVFKAVGAVADSRACVLIQGESGTGKELIARTIHRNCSTRYSPFVAVNCTALPETLLESELFGHVKGAFTGANTDRRGRFELAGDGTIFLDEIGDTTPAFQAKLLRVLQEREFYPVGSEHPRRTEARVVAATHRNLADRVASGEFREDLYFRLKVVEIRIPPLRERRSDIPLLVRHILSRVTTEINRAMPSVSPDAMALLINREWPGNIRELENLLTRAVVFSRGSTLTARSFEGESPAASRSGAEGADDKGGASRASLEDVERKHVQQVLIETGGNKTAAAKILQVSRPTLHRMIRDYQLYVP